MKDVSACRQEACHIQACLRLHNFNDAKCSTEIQQLYECCRRFYDRNGVDATNKCCPKPDLLTLKLADTEGNRGGTAVEPSSRSQP